MFIQINYDYDKKLEFPNFVQLYSLIPLSHWLFQKDITVRYVHAKRDAAYQ